jgi:3',5'-cyclic AMP phosphodiesterase CpdA
MSSLHFDRVPSRPLSLWQSAVAENVRLQLQHTTGRVIQNLVMQHPMVNATAAHVKATISGNPPSGVRDPSDQQALNVYLSHLCYEKANAKFAGDTAKADALAVIYRQYSDKDPGFATCETTYLAYKLLYTGDSLYNDWTIRGKNDLNFGVISWQLPSDAKVAIIGDWGTGLDDAIQMIGNIVARFNPTAIIHLGDIYYSGTPDECAQNFTEALTAAGAGNIPVFTIPGNHDYYALGYGFFPMLSLLNTHTPGATQQASYFCLRTVDGAWQFLGMDTGYYDANPVDQLNFAYAGPQLRSSEVQWLQDKLDHFDGATILLSHHQLYSTNAKLNGAISAYAALPYLNPYLYQPFSPYLQKKVAAWIWGHEHNFSLFQPGLLQLQQGVLLGCSAYEELTSADPFAQTYPQIPYQTPLADWQLGTNKDPDGTAYYNHAFAIMDFGARRQPADPVVTRYYQYPAWSTNPPSNADSTLLAERRYAKPTAGPIIPVSSGDKTHLFSQEGLFVSPYYQQYNCYPTATTDRPTTLIIESDRPGTIRHGDSIRIRTAEPGVGIYNRLGAWSTPTLYYYSGNDPQLQWTILKKNPGSDAAVHYGDEVCFVNKYYDQWLTLYFTPAYGNIYLSTRPDAGYYWQILKP